MTVLSNKVLKSHGPYIRFSEVTDWSGADKYDCPDVSMYEDSVFFVFSDELLELYCSLTRSYSPFDPHQSTCIKRPHAIRRLSSELLFWAIQILKCHDSAINQYLFIYENSTKTEEFTAEALRNDLVETIFYLVENFNRVAVSKSTLIIEGI